MAFGTLLAFPGTSFVGPSNEQADKEAISTLYHKADEAYTRNDLQGVLAVYAPDWVAMDNQGHKLTLSEVSEATEKMWKPAPGVRYAWHLLTDLTSITISGDTAHVDASAQLDLVREDQGTYVHVRNIATGKDELIRTPSGWKVRRTELLTTRRLADGRPSAYAMSQLQHMRDMNAQLRGFNRSNNMSNCMYSNAMQAYDYWDREQRCSN